MYKGVSWAAVKSQSGARTYCGFGESFYQRPIGKDHVSPPRTTSFTIIAYNGTIQLDTNVMLFLHIYKYGSMAQTKRCVSRACDVLHIKSATRILCHDQVQGGISMRRKHARASSFVSSSSSGSETIFSLVGHSGPVFLTNPCVFVC